MGECVGGVCVGMECPLTAGIRALGETMKVQPLLVAEFGPHLHPLTTSVHDLASKNISELCPANMSM